MNWWVAELECPSAFEEPEILDACVATAEEMFDVHVERYGLDVLGPVGVVVHEPFVLVWAEIADGDYPRNLYGHRQPH